MFNLHSPVYPNCSAGGDLAGTQAYCSFYLASIALLDQISELVGLLLRSVFFEQYWAMAGLSPAFRVDVIEGPRLVSVGWG